MKTYLRIAMVGIILASDSTFAAEGRSYLPPQKAAAILADGAPWNGSAPKGTSFKLTLQKDGTGTVRGPLLFPLSTTWTIKGDAICLSNMMMSKCLQFSQIPGGLQGWNAGQPDLKVSR